MKLASVPSCDMKFVAPNWFLTITPIGLAKPVTNEIMANKAIIMMMGSV